MKPSSPPQEPGSEQPEERALADKVQATSRRHSIFYRGEMTFSFKEDERQLLTEDPLNSHLALWLISSR